MELSALSTKNVRLYPTFWVLFIHISLTSGPFSFKDDGVLPNTIIQGCHNEYMDESSFFHFFLHDFPSKDRPPPGGLFLPKSKEAIWPGTWTAF